MYIWEKAPDGAIIGRPATIEFSVNSQDEGMTVISARAVADPHPDHYVELPPSAFVQLKVDSTLGQADPEVAGRG